MSIKTVRKARHEKLYQGRPKFSIENITRSNWAGMSLTGTNTTPKTNTPSMPKRVRPFASTNGNFDPAKIPTPSPKASENVATGKEGPPAGRAADSS